MKTEVKFRELPEKVQGFLIRMFGYSDDSNPTIKLEWLHNLPEWSEATDDERLAYAEWRYPAGTVCKRIDSECTFTICDPRNKPKFYSLYYVEKIRRDEWCDSKGNYISSNPRIYSGGKWAEIVSLPDIKEASLSAQKEFVKANPGMQHVEDFKTGEIVNEYVGGEIYQPVIYRFFAENKHWVSDTKFDSKVWCPQEIRKIDPDRQLKEVEEPKGISNFNPDAIRCSDNSKEPKDGDMVEYDISGIFTDALAIFTGAKTTTGKFILQATDCDVVYTSDRIRLPQKSEVESKVRELMGDMLPIKFVGYENTYVNWDEAKEKMIEIAKWCQANPSKI